MAEFDKRVPQVGMIFKSREEAWLFWRAYGGRVGFDVRKRYANKSPMDGKVTSCRYVCAKEGVQICMLSFFMKKLLKTHHSNLNNS
jgi:zinc finger SWIM domain-containing protein 3